MKFVAPEAPNAELPGIYVRLGKLCDGDTGGMRSRRILGTLRHVETIEILTFTPVFGRSQMPGGNKITQATSER